MAAFSEIFLMPMTIILVFTGRVSILTPFMFYRFLGLRYVALVCGRALNLKLDFTYNSRPNPSCILNKHIYLIIMIIIRYSSRRNPYTRAVFYELRISLEQAAAAPNFPNFARGILYKAIAMVSNMAPQTAYPPPEQ